MNIYYFFAGYVWRSEADEQGAAWRAKSRPYMIYFYANDEEVPDARGGPPTTR